MGWAAGSAAAGLAIAAATILVPGVARPARRHRRRGPRQMSAEPDRPRWARFGLDIVLLAASGAVVLAGRAQRLPARARARKGCPTISVSYWAFAAPGAAVDRRGAAGLAARRPRSWAGLAHRRSCPATTGPVLVADHRGHSLSRQRAPLARAVVLLALAVAFAASTATFNATYRPRPRSTPN